jgi:hypothetical protein
VPPRRWCLDLTVATPGTAREVFLDKLIEIMMRVHWLGDGVAYSARQLSSSTNTPA